MRCSTMHFGDMNRGIKIRSRGCAKRLTRKACAPSAKPHCARPCAAYREVRPGKVPGCKHHWHWFDRAGVLCDAPGRICLWCHQIEREENS